MKVIFESDDMGFSYGSVEAIKDASLEGIATSSSLVVNGDASLFACRILKTKLTKIGLGLHVNITDGIGKKSILTDEKGIYKYNFLSLFWLSLVKRRDIILAVESDIKAQLKKAGSRGIKIDHINSERYVLMIPAFFEIACKIARVNKIKYIRLSNEPLFRVRPFLKNLKPILNLNIIKFLLLNFLAKINSRILRRHSLKCADAMYGILYTNTALNMYSSVSANLLDSPATTSATTYKTQFNSAAGTASVSCQPDNTSVSYITLMEIAV